MGLLDGLLGNASEIDASKLHAEFAQVLATGERVEKAYQLIRDTFVFTDKRLIFVNRQGVTGRKVEYQSILVPEHCPLQRGDCGDIRTGRRTQDLVDGHRGSHPAAVQQEAQHLHRAKRSGRVCPPLKSLW